MAFNSWVVHWPAKQSAIWKAQYAIYLYAGFPQKPENRIPWLFHDWFACFHDSHSHMVLDMVCDCVSRHARQSQTESCYSHENKQFHDFSMTFGKFSHSKTFPWLSMTAIFSRIFHDRGNPVYVIPSEVLYMSGNARECTREHLRPLSSDAPKPRSSSVAWKSVLLVVPADPGAWHWIRLCCHIGG